MPSPLCEVKDGAGSYQATTNGVDVTPGNTITIHLIDSSADTWSIECVYTDEESDAAAVSSGLSINSPARTATFTAPVAGRAYIFRSVVNGGVGPDGRVKSSYTTTFKVCTLTSGGRRVIAANETTEGGAFGWIAPVNEGIRNPGSGATPGGSEGSAQIHGPGGTLTGVAPGASGNVLTSDGTNWTSAPAIGGNPSDGDGGEVQKSDGAGGFVATPHGSVGSVLRQTGATTSSFGALDLSSANATTNSLAGSKVTPDFGSQNVTTTGTVAGARLLAGTSPSSDGLIGLPQQVPNATIIGAKDSVGAESPILRYASADTVRLGNTSNWSVDVFGFALQLWGRTLTLYAAAGSVVVANSTGTALQTGLPLSGYAAGAFPFRLKHASVDCSAGGTITPTAAEYECPTLTLDGTPAASFDVYLPAVEDAVYNIKNNTAHDAVVGDGIVGGTVTIPPGGSRWVRRSSLEYEER